MKEPVPKGIIKTKEGETAEFQNEVKEQLRQRGQDFSTTPEIDKPPQFIEDMKQAGKAGAAFIGETTHILTGEPDHVETTKSKTPLSIHRLRQILKKAA